jgi:hypothetical protein
MEAHWQQQSEIGLTQRIEIAGFLAFLGFILWFDPRPASILPSRPPNLAAAARRACQG